MQFQVPQNIDIESKIVGPLTLKQFAFVGGPALMSFFLYFVLSFPLWVAMTVILVPLGIAFAFIKIGGRPFFIVTLLALRYYWQPKLYLWQRPIIEEVVAIPMPQRAEARRGALQMALVGISSVGKLWQDITTTKNPLPQREKVLPQRSVGEIQEQYQVFRRLTGEKDVARRIDYR